MINIIIRNKLDSINAIKKLNLNRFPEILIGKHNKLELLYFFDKFPTCYYAVRDKSKVKSSLFNLKATKEDILSIYKKLDLFTVNVSSYNFRDNQLLVGDILIKRNKEVYLIASNNGDFSSRDAEKNPDYNFKTDLYDKRLGNIIGFDDIFKYVVDNGLLDIIVEFAVFDVTVGINNEKVIIYELRTDY